MLDRIAEDLLLVGHVDEPPQLSEHEQAQHDRLRLGFGRLLGVLRVLRNGPRRNRLLVAHNLGNGLGDVARARVGLGGLFDGDDEVGHEVGRDLAVGVDERRDEADQQRVERDARDGRRVGDAIDLGEQVALDFGEGRLRCELEEPREKGKGLREQGNVAR